MKAASLPSFFSLLGKASTAIAYIFLKLVYVYIYIYVFFFKHVILLYRMISTIFVLLCSLPGVFCSRYGLFCVGLMAPEELHNPYSTCLTSWKPKNILGRMILTTIVL